MTVNVEEKNAKENFTPACYQTDETISEDNSTTDACSSSEVINGEDGDDDYVAGNNNSMFHSHHLDKSEYSFPRRIPVDMEFQNIKYTVGSFSFSKRKYGEFISFILFYLNNCWYVSFCIILYE